MGLLDQVLSSVLGGMGGQQPAGAQPQQNASPANAILIAIAAAAAQQMMRGGGAAGAPAQQGGGLGGALGTAIGGALSGAIGGALQHGQAPGGVAAPSGGLGGSLGGILSQLGGASALTALVEQFRQSGHGNIIDQWIQSGPNPTLAPGQLQAALGPETVSQLARTTGMDPAALVAQLAVELPMAIDAMTPDGRLPTDQEIHQQVGAPPPA
jgi:uncharacterized protein YidB (DUF937 family)